MSYTVAEALAMGVFKEARVVAGAAKLGNVITNAEVMETPLMSSRMRGGEFVLCSGYAFRTDPALQVRVIEQFAEKGISVFGIQVGRYFDAIPSRMIETAEAAGLPLLELPPNYSYMEFLMPFYESIVENQLQPLRYTDNLHAKMMKTMLSGNGIEGIVSLAFSQIACPLLLLDPYGNIAYCKQSYWKNKNPFAYAETFYRALQASAAQQPLEASEIRELCAPDASAYALCIRLEAGGTGLGYLLLDQRMASLSGLHRAIIRETGAFLSLELLKERAVAEAEMDARSNLLEDILDGNYRDELSALRRANYLNIDLRGGRALCYLGVDNRAAGALPGQADEGWEYEGNLPALLRQEMDRLTENYLLKADTTGFLMLCAFGGDMDYGLFCQGMRTVKHNLGAQCANGPALFLCVGREEKQLAALQHSYLDIQKMIQMARCFSFREGVVLYKEVELLLLLTTLKEEPIVQNYITDYVSPLSRYDEKCGTELEKTLQVFYQNGSSVSKTAEALFLHKNTVQYRLKRIAEVSGLNLGDYKDAFMMELCLLLKKVCGEKTS